MLDEHFGLGVVLTMQDDFSPQANRAVQSMTRMQSSAEEMSKNVQKSMSNLQNIMLSGFSLDTVGSSFQRAGTSILNVFKSIGTGLANVNASYQTKQAQLLTSFKGNAKEAKKAFDWIRQYSASTPYEVAGLTDAFSKMKATNMDLRDSFKASTGQVKTLADAIGDLATRNMGATGGVSNLAYSLQNAWSGQARSLYDRFNLSKADTDKLMSYSSTKGNNLNKFLQEFVNLAEKYAPNAIKNMNGTWSQVMSNMDDTWNNFVYDVGQAGIFNKFITTLNKVQVAMSQAFSDKKTIKTISNIFSDLWKPVDKLVDGLIAVAKWTIKFAGEHPKIAKFVAGFIAMSGVGLVLTGTIMKLAGGFLILTASVASTYLNFKLIQKLNMSGEFDFMWKSLSKTTRGLGLMGLVAGGLFLAFNSNFMGVRDTTKNAMNVISGAWKDSNSLIENGTSVLKNHGVEYDKLMIKFAKLRLLGTIIYATLFRKEANGGIQYTQKEMDNLRLFGLLPVAQAFAVLKGRAKAFIGGFKDGIGSAIVVVKNFLEIYLKPMKALFDGMTDKAGKAFSGIKSALGIKSEKGMDAEKAKSQTEQFKEIGEKAGILMGVLLGFKVIKTITPFLLSPFKLLSSAVGGSIKAVGRLKDSVGKFGKSNSVSRGLSSIASAVSETRETFRGRKTKAKARFNEFLDEYQDLAPSTSKNSENGYKRVYEMSNRYKKYVLPNQSNADGADLDNVYTKSRSKLGERLFGNTYYTKGADGTMTQLGKWGGRMNAERDDKQMILSLQKFRSNGGTISAPTLEDFGGDKKAYANVMNNHRPKLDNEAGLVKGMGGMLSDDEFEQKKMHYYKSTDVWKNRYKMGKVDGRKLTKEQRSAFNNSVLSAIAGSNDAGATQLREEESLRNSHVYAENSKHKLGQYLFGKKMYTISEDANGNFHKNTVGRTGGILRHRDNDMKYKGSFKERLKSSRLGMGASSRMSAIRAGISGGMAHVKSSRPSIALSSAKRGIGAGLSHVKEVAGNSWLGHFSTSRLHLGNTPKEHGKGLKGLGSKLSSGFHSLFGKEEFNENDVRVKEDGFFTRQGKRAKGIGHGIKGFAKGTGKIAGKLGRGAGKLLGGAGRLVGGALPFVGGALSVGKMGFDLISAQGGGDFNKGLKNVQKNLNKLNISKVWKNFKSYATKSFSGIKSLAKLVFSKMAKELPPILGDAWKGIQGMATVAWQYIQKNGASLFGKLVDWIVGKGIPTLFKGLLGIGKWMITDLLPFVWKCLQVAVPKVLKGLVDLVKNGLSSLGSIIGKAVLGALGGVLRSIPIVGKKVGKALGLPGFAVGTRYLPYDMPIMAHEGEMIVPKDENPYANTHKGSTLPKSSPKNVNNIVKIEKVEIVVKADKLSREEARTQAKYILNEMRSMGKEKLIRQYV
jgi:hypothetical protein